jgi:ketosteroid isomerase-like protein
VIVFQDLTFWTAIAQLGLGLVAGAIVGAIVKRMTSIDIPPANVRGMCPACGAPALRPVRGTAAQRAIRTITRKWPYACTRCDWPASHASHKKPANKPPVEVSEPVPVEPSVVINEPAAEAPRVEPPAVLIIDAQTVEQTMNAQTIEPESSSRMNLKDDTAQVKDSVYRYVASLNSGDVAARANCSLSEFTCFDVDGGPLRSNRFEDGHAAGPAQSFNLRCRDLRVYVYKDTAIATAYLVGTVTSTTGTPVHVTGRSSWVHLRQNGEWKIAHSHLSPLNPDA